MNIDPIQYTGRPSDERIQKEVSTYDFLDSLGVKYTRADHGAAATIEDCIGIEKILGTKICKNLLLCNQQKTKFYLLMMPGDKQFSTKDFSKQIGSSRLSFAPAEAMERLLDITPGSLSVLGLMNDKECEVTLYMDKAVAADEYIGVHPCINTSTLKISTADIIEKIIPATGHTANFVEL